MSVAEKASRNRGKSVRAPLAGKRAASKDGGVTAVARVEAVMRAAERSGLLTKKSGRIGGRVSQALVRQAKRLTGIEADTELIEFALASVALEDKFAEVFKGARGKVDPDIKLGF